MLAGLLLFAATLCLHAAAAFGRERSAPAAGTVGKPHPTNARGGTYSKHCDSNMATRAVDALVAWGLLARPAGRRWPAPTVAGALAALVAVHVLGIFSFFFLLSEGERGPAGPCWAYRDGACLLVTPIQHT